MNERYLQTIKIDWDLIPHSSYLHQISALRHLTELELESNIVFFVGENGTGKSTLLEAIAIAYGFNPEGGSRNFTFSTRDTHSPLHTAIRLIKGPRSPKTGYFLRAESFYNVATKADEYESKLPDLFSRAGKKSYHQLSHGESFLALMQGTFSPKGIYFLDEPEAALSPQRQLTLLLHLLELAKAGAQFVIASHSPILLAAPGAILLSFDDGRLHPCTYEETESYQVTEMFINHRDYFLAHLMEDENETIF